MANQMFYDAGDTESEHWPEMVQHFHSEQKLVDK